MSSGAMMKHMILNDVMQMPSAEPSRTNLTSGSRHNALAGKLGRACSKHKQNRHAMSAIWKLVPLSGPSRFLTTVVLTLAMRRCGICALVQNRATARRHVHRGQSHTSCRQVKCPCSERSHNLCLEMP